MHDSAVRYIKLLIAALIMSFPLGAFAGSADQPQWQPVAPATFGRSAKTMMHGNLGDNKRGTLTTEDGRTYIVPRPVAICSALSGSGQRVGWMNDRKCVVPASASASATALFVSKDYFVLDYSNKLIWQAHKPGKPFPKNTVLGNGASAKVKPCLALVKHSNWYVKGKRLRPRSEVPGYIPADGKKHRCVYVEVGTDQIRSSDDYKILLH